MARSISDVASLVNEILAFVRGPAQAMEIGEVERRLVSMVMAVGRACLEVFVAEKGTGYAGKEIIGAEGNRRPYVRDRSRVCRSIFGAIFTPRAYYHDVGSPGAFPLNGELNLPERGYSYLVQEFSSRLAVKMSYKDALEILCSFFPLKMPIRSLDSIVGDVCDEVDRFYEEKAPPDFCPEAVVTVATVDKKGIVIGKPQGGEAGPERTSVDPDKPGKKKMATVISTYVTSPHVRTAEEMFKEVSEGESSNSRPKPQNKLTWCSLIDGQEKTVARLKKAVDQRLPKANKLVCIL